MPGNRLLCGASHYSGYSGYSFQKLDAPTAIAEAPVFVKVTCRAGAVVWIDWPPKSSEAGAAWKPVGGRNGVTLTVAEGALVPTADAAVTEHE